MEIADVMNNDHEAFCLADPVFYDNAGRSETQDDFALTSRTAPHLGVLRKRRPHIQVPAQPTAWPRLLIDRHPRDGGRWRLDVTGHRSWVPPGRESSILSTTVRQAAPWLAPLTFLARGAAAANLALPAVLGRTVDHLVDGREARALSCSRPHSWPTTAPRDLPEQGRRRDGPRPAVGRRAPADRPRSLLPGAWPGHGPRRGDVPPRSAHRGRRRGGLPPASRHTTLVVVTHRLSSARRADRVLLMDGPNIAVGAHDDLV